MPILAFLERPLEDGEGEGVGVEVCLVLDAGAVAGARSMLLGADWVTVTVAGT